MPHTWWCTCTPPMWTSLIGPVSSPVPDALRFLIRTVTKRVTPYVTTKPTSIHSAAERPVLTTWSTYQVHMGSSLR